MKISKTVISVLFTALMAASFSGCNRTVEANDFEKYHMACATTFGRDESHFYDIKINGHESFTWNYGEDISITLSDYGDKTPDRYNEYVQQLEDSIEDGSYVGTMSSADNDAWNGVVYSGTDYKGEDIYIGYYTKDSLVLYFSSYTPESDELMNTFLDRYGLNH